MEVEVDIYACVSLRFSVLIKVVLEEYGSNSHFFDRHAWYCTVITFVPNRKIKLKHIALYMTYEQAHTGYTKICQKTEPPRRNSVLNLQCTNDGQKIG